MTAEVAFMQVQPTSRLELIGSLDEDTRAGPLSPCADTDLLGDLDPIPSNALQLLKPNPGPVYVICCAVAGALALGFGLGWASGSTWYGTPTVIASIALPNTPPARTELKSAPKAEGARKQTTLGAASNSSSKIPNLSTSSVLRSDGQTSRTAAPSLPLDLPTGSIASREPLYPAPETRPATIAGWTVRDVRGGTAVLDGPDGIRSAMVGDTVPGVGRIESIVRWGNRWIVATANGLIATP
jgi:hypothetical protein